VSNSTPPLAAVLLDLDGTLLDTAPDMAAALNTLRAQESLPALDFALIRPHVSHGANAVVRVGFPEADEPQFEALRERFLQRYRAHIAVHTRLFEGFDYVLEQLEAHGVPWGIITNKAAWLTEPLLAELSLLTRAACVLSGDSLPERKPHPRPLLVAAARLGLPPQRCLYLGDALRDMQAARDAGMTALVASFGYIGPTDDARNWPAVGWLDEPGDLLPWVGLRKAPPRQRAVDV